MILSREQAQSLVLSSQGLSTLYSVEGEKGVLEIAERLGYIQIDTLAVVSRAHHHTLWARVPGYKEEYLNQLLEEKKLFEYWSHAASYLPMCDFRFSLPRKRDYAKGKSHWFEQDKKMKKYVIDRIKAEGPLQSKNFEFKRNTPGNWYEWKPAKRALEQLFMEGKLMVAKRQGFQKVYDLTERILPSTVETCLPSEKEMAEHLIKRALHAHGITNASEITYLKNSYKIPVVNAIKQMIKDGQIKEVFIDGFDKPYYIDAESKIEKIVSSTTANRVHLLSPFDNVVIQRKRLQNIFNFDYMIECYLPEAKRKYGYFTLPVLYNNNFVARFDPKANRAEKTFYIKSMHFENGFKPTDHFNVLFAEKLKAFALFNGCTSFKIELADNGWKKKMKELLK